LDLYLLEVVADPVVGAVLSVDGAVVAGVVLPGTVESVGAVESVGPVVTGAEL
jgi:hypothetical protein